MNNFAIVVGYMTMLTIIIALGIIVVNIIYNRIKKYKEFKKMSVIKSGTHLYNHDKNLKIIIKKDIRIKFKKQMVIEATIDDDRLYGEYALGLDKANAQTNLEKEIIDIVSKRYNDGYLQGYIINDYIGEIIEM